MKEMDLITAMKIIKESNRHIEEAVLSREGFQNQVKDALMKFDQTKHVWWRRKGRYVTVVFRTAEYEGAEELAKLMARTLNGISGWKTELLGVGNNGDEWFADFKFTPMVDESINESYLEEADVGELYEVAADALLFADQVHIWHWSCQSGFQHVHFEEIYEALRDFADELVEVCLASGKNLKYSIGSSMNADSNEFEMQTAIEKLEEKIDELQAAQDKFRDYSEITAVFDDILKKLSKELGLLKNFV